LLGFFVATNVATFLQGALQHCGNFMIARIA
jgi:hypothetical protein